jgi:peptidoglycan/xylan/chitin deacetylase (PgdA/CDA1 family)
MELARHVVMYLPRDLWLCQVIKRSADLHPESQKLIIILSSDTEFDPPLGNETWKQRSTRGFVDGLDRFLELCDRYKAPATLFCEGKLVEQFPDIFRENAHRHEIGCHAYNHEWLGVRAPPRSIPRCREFPVLSFEAKALVLRRAIKCIENAVGRTPKAFKAPFNSVDHASTLTLLDSVGFDSDSSLPCYNNESFRHPLRPAPCRHGSKCNLWNEGAMRLIEVPFMIRPRPLFLHPFDDVIDTAARGMKLAIESVNFQARIDMLSGRGFTLVHVTSHPWEFSETKLFGCDGRANAKRLEAFLDELSSSYDARFLTVTEFVGLWERESCHLHSNQTG